MRKKMLILMLCFALLLPAFSLRALGETEQTQELEQNPEQETAATEETLPPTLLDTLRQMRDQTQANNESNRIRRQILDTHITTLERTGH